MVAKFAQGLLPTKIYVGPQKMIKVDETVEIYIMVSFLGANTHRPKKSDLKLSEE